ncbi:hypothetical protein [Streptomyces sp. NPDC012825]|uniref:hypothetical protein n=1 Tax=Streptomyces sp. NPDC012825 TaxID=3364851 RepID=UPI00367715CD
MAAGGEVDIVPTCCPMHEEGIVMGLALVKEVRVLAAPTGHPFARRATVSVEDPARVIVPQIPRRCRNACDRTGRRAGPRREADRARSVGHDARRDADAGGRGGGGFAVGTRTRCCFTRPDVVHVPFEDAAPVDWDLVRPTDGATARVRAFGEAAFHPVQAPA